MEWEKVLFRKQDFLDNYVEPSYFLKELKRNLYTPTYSRKELIYSSAVVIRPFTSVCFFVCLYFYLKEGLINSLTLFTVFTLCFILIALITTEDAINSFLQPSAFLHVFLCGVAPILCTLTQSISSDTLWAMTVSMLLFHLIFYSYRIGEVIINNAISLNAAMFAAVCLASTLRVPLDGFVLVSMSVHIFIFSPQFDRCSSRITILLVVITSFALISISFTATAVFFVMIISLLILFPMWLHTLQDLKNNIYGPWDEAVIQ